MNNNKKFPDKEILLVEYQAAQSSAEHHDTLVWTVTSIIWAANLVLLGFMLNSINKIELKGWLLAFSFLGIFLCVNVWIFACQFRKIKNKKYNRCKFIEKKLKMRQHLSIRDSKVKQWTIYSIITGMFIGLWIGVICFVLVCLYRI